MVKICKGCGGILGRDCFNEAECMQITRNMEDANFVEPYIIALQECKKLIDWMSNNMTGAAIYQDHYANMFDNTMALICQLIPYERTPEQIQADLDELPF